MNTKILVVDDNNMNVRLLKEILEDEGYEVYSCLEGLSVLKTTYEVKPDAILLDIMMPGIDGFQVCSLLKKDFETKDIPVIMVTAKNSGNDIKDALELGAFDYIKKPIDEVEVIARLKSALRYKSDHDKLKELAMKDGLTGLYNHSLLIELFDKELKKQSDNGGNIAFVMLDIDYFKTVNDTYGHVSGDRILRELSEILISYTGKSNIIGRYGGEEFGIVLPELDKEAVFDLCEEIRLKVEENSFDIGDKIIGITVSMGICYKSGKKLLRSGEIIEKADEALYRAKENGRNRIETFFI
ncbi:MAG: diguanylate cyclase [Bacillota bacterium]|nr:diguanylate cyclase [Bacillota bacterium]